MSTTLGIGMDFDEITFETRGAVATVTLNRPAKLNAISGRPGGTRDQIVEAVERAEADDEVGCLVVAGSGRGFSSGGDLTGNARRETLDEHYAFLKAAEDFHERIRTSRVPTIAAVHGVCLGAGLLLAASCDFVVASEDATFGFPEGRLGLVGGAVLTPQIGRQWAKFLMLTGESVDAETARRIDLVLSIEPTERLMGRVGELAARIARMPRSAVELNRRAIDAAADAAGGVDARRAALENDARTLDASGGATAPDGRTFREIIETEGMEGLKAARAAQYETPWLQP